MTKKRYYTQESTLSRFIGVQCLACCFLSLKTSLMLQMFGELSLDKNLKRDYDDHVWQTLTVNVIRNSCFVVFNCVNKISRTCLRIEENV